ncbi:P-II family nitrogen regulator [Proteiniclasticum sp. C24MP]|uniref:P-II family nitrogen regulator n=1 Tax=Proteiniclasticum sp. C24MP TaxID=3374101 RepID=UPI0037547B2B
MNNSNLEVFIYIVNHNDGSRVMKQAKKHGVRGTTAFLGHGTIESALLDFLGLNDVRKELILMVTDEVTGQHAMKGISKDLRLDKPGKGIAFSLNVTRFLGSRGYSREENRGEKEMYEAIFVIVDKGKGEFVIDAAKKAGSKGATLINARGSGIHETSTLFAMEIEPEKEIILILSESSGTEKIIEAVSTECEIEKPGNGILFTCDVKRTLGLYQGK